MIHKLKILGLAIGSAFALAFLSASGALAQAKKGWVTAPESATVTATEVTKNVLTYNAAQRLECEGHYDIGEEDKTVSGNPGVHPPMVFPQTIVTVTPKFTNCQAIIGETKVEATVTMNGCDFLTTLGTTTGSPDEYAVDGHLICEPGKEVEVHVYSNATHATTICTYKFPAAGNQERKGATLRDITNGTLTLGGKFDGISATRTGILCGGSNSTANASVDVDSMVHAVNEQDQVVPLAISEMGE